MGDQPRLRPIAPVKTDGFTVYIANLRSYGKTAEIESNRASRSVISTAITTRGASRPGGNRHRKAIKAEIWDSNPHHRNYLVGVENPDFILYQWFPREFAP